MTEQQNSGGCVKLFRYFSCGDDASKCKEVKACCKFGKVISSAELDENAPYPEDNGICPNAHECLKNFER